MQRSKIQNVIQFLRKNTVLIHYNKILYQYRPLTESNGVDNKILFYGLCDVILAQNNTQGIMNVKLFTKLFLFSY